MKCSDCSENIQPVVCIDIDGTLAQYHNTFARFLEEYLPCEDLPRDWDGHGEFSDHLEVDKHQYRQAKLAFRAGGFKRWMPPFSGATKFMHGLQSMGLEIWVTTTRPWQRMDSVDPDTKEWLRRNGIPYRRLLFDDEKYTRICELIDPKRVVMVLDDEIDHAEKCQDLGLPFVLFGTEWNNDVHEDFTGFPRVDGYEEATKLAEERIGIGHALQLF